MIATCCRSCAFSRCCHSGVRCPGRRRGRSSARAAFSRKRPAKSGLCAIRSSSRSSSSSGGIAIRSTGGGVSESGSRRAMPSSAHIASTSMPSVAAIRASRASAQGACTRPPNGESTHTRQSPISSRNRSTTMVRSDGTTPVCRLLVFQVGVQVPGGALVEVRREAAGAGGLADGPAELEGAADAVALPERHPPGHAGRGRHEDAVAGDLLDPPRRGAQLEHLALAGLVDHLLVELADAGAGVGQEDAVEAAVGDRPAARDGQPAGVRAGADDARRAVPDDPRAQLGELVGRIAAGQHVEHALELGAGEVVVGVGAGDELVQLVDRPVVEGSRGHQLLGEHVERLARYARVLDFAAAHAVDDDRRLEQVAAVLRDEAARSTARPPGARPGRPAAGRRRPTSATRPVRPGRSRPCRSRARATMSRRAPAAGPT